jgi:hypothetical protein
VVVTEIKPPLGYWKICVWFHRICVPLSPADDLPGTSTITHVVNIDNTRSAIDNELIILIPHTLTAEAARQQS